MILKKINYHHFKILNTEILEFHSHLNFIFGNNGFGKTSFLEAIHYIFAARSFFHLPDGDFVQYTKEYFQLEAVIEKKGRLYKAYAFYNKMTKQKRYLIDNKKVSQYYTLLSHFPLVYFTPFDSEILRGGPSERRRFFDRTLSYHHKEYYDTLKKYQKLIREKNVLLKNKEDSLLPIWNEQIVELGYYLIQLRREHLIHLNDIIKQCDFSFYGLEDGLEIQYQGVYSKEELKNLIEKNQEKEIYRKISLYGPHRDDYIFYAKKEQLPMKNKLSLGQTKMLAFYLKVLELLLLNQKLKEKPIFLIDDIFSELDIVNKEKIMELLYKLPNQIFLTTTKESINFYKEDIKGMEIEIAGEIKNNF